MSHHSRVCTYSWAISCDDEAKKGIGTIYLIYPSAELGGVTVFFLGF